MALENRKLAAYWEYDFAKDGGAVGDIALRGGKIPAGAIVNNGTIDVEIGCTSGGSATLALALVSAADIKAATAVATFSLAAILATVPVGTAATSVRTTAYSGLTLSIGVAALTAGKLNIALEYYMPRG